MPDGYGSAVGAWPGGWYYAIGFDDQAVDCSSTHDSTHGAVLVGGEAERIKLLPHVVGGELKRG